MNTIKLVILLLLVTVTTAFAQTRNNKKALNNSSIEYLNHSFGTYDQLQKTIWANPELGFLEYKSSGLLQEHLKEKGFEIEAGVAGMPTSFVATYGSGSPVIGILAEFDALPDYRKTPFPM